MVSTRLTLFIRKDFKQTIYCYQFCLKLCLKSANLLEKKDMSESICA